MKEVLSLFKFKKLCEKQQKIYDDSTKRVKERYDRINMINEKMCELHLDNKNNEIALIECELKKLDLMEEVSRILTCYDEDYMIFGNYVLYKKILKSEILNKDKMFKAKEDLNNLENIYLTYEKAQKNLLKEKNLAHLAFDIISHDTVDREEFRDNSIKGFYKFVFAGDIIAILELLKEEKFSTEIKPEAVKTLEDRIEKIKTDIPLPILPSEYMYLQILYKEAENARVDIPYNRSESKIRNFFCVKHENKNCVFPELTDYKLEY